jgi:hypothetical protein
MGNPSVAETSIEQRETKKKKKSMKLREDEKSPDDPNHWLDPINITFVAQQFVVTASSPKNSIE